MVSVRACPTHGVVLASGVCPEFLPEFGDEVDVATQNLVRSVQILSVIFNFTDAVVVRYVGRGSGVRGRPCHVSIDLFFAAPGCYYTASGVRRPSPSVVTLKLWFLSALVRHMALF